MKMEIYFVFITGAVRLLPPFKISYFFFVPKTIGPKLMLLFASWVAISRRLFLLRNEIMKL